MAAAVADRGSWDILVYQVLRERFGFKAFRGVQEAAVQAALAGRDVFVLMPTGGGKSLCYALPAVVGGGLVVVVSPLIALMQDQVAGLQAHGVDADYLSSTRSTAERQALMTRLSQLPAGPHAAAPAAAAAAAAAAGVAMVAGSNDSSSSSRLTLLYVTPELLATDSFRQQLVSLHKRHALQLLAVDEAHCISSWGHDFRPKYRQLAALRRQLPGLPCLALTATATNQVQQDILASLNMQEPVVLRQSFNRPNIHYTVVLLDVQDPPSSCSNSSSNAITSRAAGAAVSSLLGDDDASEAEADVDHAGYQHLLQLLKTPIQQQPQPDQPGQPEQQQQQQQQQQQKQQQQQQQRHRGPVTIVYALKRQTVDALVRRLSGAGLKVAGYHAAMKDTARGDVLEQWRAGALQVVVATVAFGMGVDKGDIDQVVHYNLPKSIESFYQEAGRAGRAGQPARSVLFYATRDRRRMDFVLQKEQSRRTTKRSKQGSRGAAAAAAAQPSSAAATAGSTDAAAADPAVAAAGLKAFGAVVELCVTPSCRRARLLQHFGEQLQQAPPARDPLRHRCCDFCDNSSVVETAAAQLKQQEAQLVQKWSSGVGGAWGRKRQRRDGSSSLFDGQHDDDSEGDEVQDPGSSDVDEELDPDSAAAAAAVRRAAAAATATARVGPRGGAGSSSTVMATSAFLSAMEAAEERHNRAAQQAAGGGGGGDPLSRLMAAKEASAGAPKQAVTVVGDDVRAARRSKLAELIAANPGLTGCTAAAAADLAEALEVAVHSTGMSLAQHRAALAKVAAAVKAASSWTELPELQRLSPKGLTIVVKHAVAAVTKEASSSSTPCGEGAAVRALQQLAVLPVTVDVLEETGAAKHVKALRKHKNQQVATAAGAVITAWRAAVGS